MAHLYLRSKTARILLLSSSEGMGQETALSSRPGRRRAASIRSGREDAARTYTPPRPSTPSSSVKSLESWCRKEKKRETQQKLLACTTFISSNLVNYPVRYTCVVGSSFWRYCFELIKENNTWGNGTCLIRSYQKHDKIWSC